MDSERPAKRDPLTDDGADDEPWLREFTRDLRKRAEELKDEERPRPSAFIRWLTGRQRARPRDRDVE